MWYQLCIMPWWSILHTWQYSPRCPRKRGVHDWKTQTRQLIPRSTIVHVVQEMKFSSSLLKMKITVGLLTWQTRDFGLGFHWTEQVLACFYNCLVVKQLLSNLFELQAWKHCVGKFVTAQCSRCAKGNNTLWQQHFICTVLRCLSLLHWPGLFIATPFPTFHCCPSPFHACCSSNIFQGFQEYLSLVVPMLQILHYFSHSLEHANINTVVMEGSCGKCLPPVWESPLVVVEPQAAIKHYTDLTHSSFPHTPVEWGGESKTSKTRGLK